MPWGLAGGEGGTPSHVVLNPGAPNERHLKAMDTTTIEHGEVIRLVCPGAAGWGNPLERDRLAIAADVKAGKLTPRYVREHYAVAMDEDGVLDPIESDRLRDAH